MSNKLYRSWESARKRVLNKQIQLPGRNIYFLQQCDIVKLGKTWIFVPLSRFFLFFLFFAFRNYFSAFFKLHILKGEYRLLLIIIISTILSSSPLSSLKFSLFPPRRFVLTQIILSCGLKLNLPLPVKCPLTQVVSQHEPYEHISVGGACLPWMGGQQTQAKKISKRWRGLGEDKVVKVWQKSTCGHFQGFCGDLSSGRELYNNLNTENLF